MGLLLGNLPEYIMVPSVQPGRAVVSFPHIEILSYTDFTMVLAPKTYQVCYLGPRSPLASN